MNLKTTPKALRLFAIKDTTSGRIVPNLFFSDKMKAKAERTNLGAGTHCVTYGPDHRHYKA